VFTANATEDDKLRVDVG